MGVRRVAAPVHTAVAGIGAEITGRVDILKNTRIIHSDEARWMAFQHYCRAPVAVELAKGRKVDCVKDHRVPAPTGERWRNDAVGFGEGSLDQLCNRFRMQRGHVAQGDHDNRGLTPLDDARSAERNRVTHAESGRLGYQRFASSLAQGCEKFGLAGGQDRKNAPADTRKCVRRSRRNGFTVKARKQLVTVTACIEPAAPASGEQQSDRTVFSHNNQQWSAVDINHQPSAHLAGENLRGDRE